LTHYQIFGPREIDVFSKVVSVAEKAGKYVELLAVAVNDPALCRFQRVAERGTNPWAKGILQRVRNMLQSPAGNHPVEGNRGPGFSGIGMIGVN
jgi:hypothetical protein